MGWTIDGEIPHDERRVLAVFLPHTSNWDFVIGWLLICAEKITITIFGKDQFNFFPFNYAYRYFNVVPISRKKSQNSLNKRLRSTTTMLHCGREWRLKERVVIKRLCAVVTIILPKKLACRF